MRLYFAYGSNMSSRRLIARVGEVQVLGWSTLGDHRHAFDKRGADGTGKGNIVAAAGREVHGVLYGLSAAQLQTLTGFEGGYRVVERRVLRARCGGDFAAVTYQALEPMAGLSPTAEYLAHYAAGMREHGLPAQYASALLGSAPQP